MTGLLGWSQAIYSRQTTGWTSALLEIVDRNVISIIFCISLRRKPFTCPEQEHYPHDSVTLNFFVLGKKISFCLSPFLSLIYCMCLCSSSDCFGTDDQLFTPEQLLLGNWITDEEKSCYLNTSLRGNLGYQSIIFSARAPCLS